MKPTAAPKADNQIVRSGVEDDDLAQLVALHGRDPKSWDARALARKYEISDVKALEMALNYVRAYEVVETDDGPPIAVAIEPKATDAQK